MRVDRIYGAHAVQLAQSASTGRHTGQLGVGAAGVWYVVRGWPGGSAAHQAAGQAGDLHRRGPTRDDQRRARPGANRFRTPTVAAVRR